MNTHIYINTFVTGDENEKLHKKGVFCEKLAKRHEPGDQQKSRKKLFLNGMPFFKSFRFNLLKRKIKRKMQIPHLENI